MRSYAVLAARTVQTIVRSPALRGIIREGLYRRVIPPTPEATGRTLEAPVSVLLDAFSIREPQADALWKPQDHVAAILQSDVPMIAVPHERDQIYVDGLPYTVVQAWDETVGLLWHMQVRN